MPAAAAIPAPIAYIKIVAVKKLVVGFLLMVAGPPSGRVSGTTTALPKNITALDCVVWYWEILL